MGKLGQEALSPQELASLQDSISSFAASQQGLVADDSLNVDAMSQLLSQHVQGMLGEGSAAQSSQSMLLLLLSRNHLHFHIVSDVGIIFKQHLYDNHT